MQKFVVGMLVGLVAALILCGGAQAADRVPAATDEGRAIAARNCAGCHAIGQTGQSPNPEAPLFRRLYERYPVEMLSEALAEGIMVGHPEMPPVVLEPRQIEAFIGYLKSLEPAHR